MDETIRLTSTADLRTNRKAAANKKISSPQLHSEAVPLAGEEAETVTHSFSAKGG